MEYSGKNILEFIHSSCSIGLLRHKKEILNGFSDNTWNYCILTQIWLEILCFDPHCKFQTHFGGLRKPFWEECTLGTDSTLNFILESSVNLIFVFLEILRFEIRLLISLRTNCLKLNDHRYHQREAVVVSALQVEKHPLTTPGPYSSPLVAAKHVIAQIAPSVPASPGRLSFASSSRNFSPKKTPQSSPKMKLR